MRTCALLLFYMTLGWMMALLSSCSAPYHHAAVYANGHLVKEETDFNPSIGGVHSQKGADGYQADDDNQQSLRDVVTAAGTVYGVHGGVQTNASNNSKDVSTGAQGVQNTALTHPVTSTTAIVRPNGSTLNTSTTVVPAIPK